MDSETTTFLLIVLKIKILFLIHNFFLIIKYYLNNTKIIKTETFNLTLKTIKKATARFKQIFN